MAADRTPAAAAKSRHVSADSSSESSSESEQPGAFPEDSDSDSLDSQGSRKRRRISPTEEDKDDELRIHMTAAPSRIKARLQGDSAASQSIDSRILVQTDDQATFASLSVKPWLENSLVLMAIKRPNGIQKGCIPEILKGRDCIGGSRTGSGKTVAFAVPSLQKWAEDPFGIFALVLTPTRYSLTTNLKMIKLLTVTGNWHSKFLNNSKPFLHRSI